MARDLAIDLGTANTLVYARGAGIIPNEPSVIALNSRTREVLAMGRDAWQMIGRTPSYIVAVHGFHIPEPWYNYHLKVNTALVDIFIGMIKGFVFGILIVIVACHQGLKASHGAVGVGKSTTSTVVIASLAILIVNFFLTFLLNFFFPLGVS